MGDLPAIRANYTGGGKALAGFDRLCAASASHFSVLLAIKFSCPVTLHSTLWFARHTFNLACQQ
jgi:hypothetical protein